VMFRRARTVVGGLAIALAAGCVDDGGAEVSKQRGAPPIDGSQKAADAAIAKEAGGKQPSSRSAAPAKPAAAPAAAAAPEEVEEPVAPPPERPLLTLDAKSFTRRRDPFQGFSPTEVVVAEPDRPRAKRAVEMPQYAFEDLKLVAIVNAGRGMRPRALFVASDGRSQAIKQGEYFSSAEVLLAAVNRDYVEIEVVDDDLAASLNLARGERRAIQLRNE
jgi:Tfp pilus assembly protein PilP